MYLNELLGLCKFGVDQFKIFVDGVAVAIIEKIDNKGLEKVIGDSYVFEYNIQTINEKTVMFVYC